MNVLDSWTLAFHTKLLSGSTNSKILTHELANDRQVLEKLFFGRINFESPEKLRAFGRGETARPCWTPTGTVM
jgi:hypothetical protein